jgi:hypothetical protein
MDGEHHVTKVLHVAADSHKEHAAPAEQQSHGKSVQPQVTQSKSVKRLAPKMTRVAADATMKSMVPKGQHQNDKLNIKSQPRQAVTMKNQQKVNVGSKQTTAVMHTTGKVNGKKIMHNEPRQSVKFTGKSVKHDTSHKSVEMKHQKVAPVATSARKNNLRSKIEVSQPNVQMKKPNLMPTEPRQSAKVDSHNVASKATHQATVVKKQTSVKAESQKTAPKGREQVAVMKSSAETPSQGGQVEHQAPVAKTSIRAEHLRHRIAELKDQLSDQIAAARQLSANVSHPTIDHGRIPVSHITVAKVQQQLDTSKTLGQKFKEVAKEYLSEPTPVFKHHRRKVSEPETVEYSHLIQPVHISHNLRAYLAQNQ